MILFQMSKATEDMSKKVESNKRAIKSSNRKQDKLQVRDVKLS